MYSYFKQLEIKLSAKAWTNQNILASLRWEKIPITDLGNQQPFKSFKSSLSNW